MGRRERLGVYKAFSQPTYARIYIRGRITNHPVKSRDGVTKRKPAGHQNSMSKSTNLRLKQERGRSGECAIA